MKDNNTNITIIKLTANDTDKFEEFYKDSSLTFFGVIPEEIQLYRDFFKSFTDIDESKPCYLFSGRMMNDYYKLTGRKAYPRNLNIVVFKLDTFKEPMKICIPRFQIGGRWFDDVVNNNMD